MLTAKTVGGQRAATVAAHDWSSLAAGGTSPVCDAGSRVRSRLAGNKFKGNCR
jgi:hypothetical protein